MLRYVCDWCGRRKQSSEEWLLGIAAEHVGARQTRREFYQAPMWDERDAQSRLAVHFCSESHLNQYVSALFGQKPARRRAASRVTTTSTPAGRSQALAAVDELVQASGEAAAPRRRRKPKLKARKLFDAADRLRAHAMGISLE